MTGPFSGGLFHVEFGASMSVGTGSSSARSVLAWEPEGGRFELEEC